MNQAGEVLSQLQTWAMKGQGNVVVRRGKATYWVVNSLLDELSNETMLAIAKGLKPINAVS